MRGEYESRTGCDLAGHGSSPHAWGIRVHSLRSSLVMRFIPTCVGNTELTEKEKRTATVHPHMRGEYICATAVWCVNGGSSPHAWGIPLGKSKKSVYARFIPTCVGNTQNKNFKNTNNAVHPHVRGEYLFTSFATGEQRGSSPRAWGIRRWINGKQIPRRFIPTCVGNTTGCRKRGR